ncbi:MAG: hypothetical protein FWF12_10595 [Betaproteobacteria bacterium]|nr:hypothetical protein [Betaproteobacteria bacterium]
MKTLLPLACAFLVCTATAQVPVPLLDPPGGDAMAGHTPIPNWGTVAPLLKEAAECRRTVAGTPALRALLPTNGAEGLQITVPADFAVFGMPVQGVTITKNGTAAMVMAHPATARDKVAAAAPAAPVGHLSVEERLPLISDVICATGGKQTHIGQDRGSPFP